ncbi:MAG: hypothetical protein R3F62_24590 [Planctomycetota bacterium]
MTSALGGVAIAVAVWLGWRQRGRFLQALRQRIAAWVCPTCNRVHLGEFGPWEHVALRPREGVAPEACAHHLRAGAPGDCRGCHVLRLEALG